MTSFLSMRTDTGSHKNNDGEYVPIMVAHRGKADSQVLVSCNQPIEMCKLVQVIDVQKLLRFIVKFYSKFNTSELQFSWNDRKQDKAIVLPARYFSCKSATFLGE